MGLTGKITMFAALVCFIWLLCTSVTVREATLDVIESGMDTVTGFVVHSFEGSGKGQENKTENKTDSILQNIFK
jgi:hypothetical protein